VVIGATPARRTELALDVAPREPRHKPPADSGSY
jgi:hypothetical protein